MFIERFDANTPSVQSLENAINNNITNDEGLIATIGTVPLFLSNFKYFLDAC